MYGGILLLYGDLGPEYGAISLLYGGFPVKYGGNTKRLLTQSHLRIKSWQQRVI